MSALAVVPVSFAAACDFVAEHHRHHSPPVGHKFSIGVADGDDLVAVAIVGRPVARSYDDGWTLEVTRSCTDGTEHTNSMLYGAAWRAAKAMGYRRLITYTQDGEGGASLRGAGWRVVAQRPPRKGWDTPSRRRSDRGTDGIARTLWEAQAGSSSLAAVLPPLVSALLLVLSVAYREQVRTLVWLTPLALLLLAVVVGCVWLAGRLTARPPMTEHLRPSDDERRLLERLR